MDQQPTEQPAAADVQRELLRALAQEAQELSLYDEDPDVYADALGEARQRFAQD